MTTIIVNGSDCAEHFWLLDRWVQGEPVFLICRDCRIQQEAR